MQFLASCLPEIVSLGERQVAYPRPSGRPCAAPALPAGALLGDFMSLDKVVTVAEVTVEDVQRILDLSRILRSVLTEEELMEIEKSIKQKQNEIGNTGDS